MHRMRKHHRGVKSGRCKAGPLEEQRPIDSFRMPLRHPTRSKTLRACVRARARAGLHVHRSSECTRLMKLREQSDDEDDDESAKRRALANHDRGPEYDNRI